MNIAKSRLQIFVFLSSGVPMYVASLDRQKPPSYKATISYNIVSIDIFDIPPQEDTPLINPDLLFPNGGLIRGSHCTV